MRFIDRMITVFAAFGSALIVCVMAFVSLEVVMRYFFHKPQIWVVEISEYVLVWSTFLGAAWVLKEEGHIQVDIVYQNLSNRVRAWLGVFSTVLGVFVSLVFIIFGTRLVWGMFITLEADPKSQIGMPKGPLLAIIPLCSVLLLIQFVRRGKKYLNLTKASFKSKKAR